MYIKRLELCNFKSFGGSTAIPLLPGFTVISGPNGSGKSNLIDALLFCLGLAGSKGMRAERLPDLVNHTQSSRSRATVEASVTVTFDLTDEPELLDVAIERQMDEMAGAAAVPTNGATNGAAPDPNGNGHVADANGQMIPREWSVTRKLRVTPQGTYTSNYYINGEPCTLTLLHEELGRLRIYPEGYNVVLQGDVTRIISMNARERREIIDELAGVATFDRKINQARDKLDAVKEKEDRYRIVETELIEQRDRLAQDRLKAEKYQKLRAELQTKEQWEAVLNYRQLEQHAARVRQQIATDEAAIAQFATDLQALTTEIQQATDQLATLNQRVKALGEEELLQLQATLANREAELRQLGRREADTQTQRQTVEAELLRLQQAIQDHQQRLQQLAQEQGQATQAIQPLQQARDAAREALEAQRTAASNSADQADAWVREQTDLYHQIETLVNALEPQRAEQAQLQERIHQLERQVAEQQATLHSLEHQLAETQAQRATLDEQRTAATTQVQTLAQQLAATEQELQLQRDTQTRLQREQREKQRDLDRLEAQTQAMQDAQGTGAAQLILQSDLPGVCGLVAQLGRVDPRYQLALETAAGGRLGQLVVEDDGVAAAGIELLKQRRAGRATFLPLNKLRRSRALNRREIESLPGCVDYAFNLIEFEPEFENVFAYVFSTTLVFESLHDARRHMGQHRIVTLEGELLETSGAMTGGSQRHRSTLHFGTVAPSESAEVLELRDRLEEITQVLDTCEATIQHLTVQAQHRSQQLMEARQQHRELELQHQQATNSETSLTQQLTQGQTQLAQQQATLAESRDRLATLTTTIPEQEQQLQAHRQTLAALEQNQTHSEWQQIQATLRAAEATLQERAQALQQAEQHRRDLEIQHQREQEKLEETQRQLDAQRQHQTQSLQDLAGLQQQQDDLQQQIQQTQQSLAALERRIGDEKQTRDRAEQHLRERQHQHQQLDWQRQKTQEVIETRQGELAQINTQLTAQQQELPDPLPTLPDNLTVEQLPELQHQIRTLQKRIQAMEPVNMLALEEYERTETRLQELSDKLATLQQERTELLLRIENFTTLRQRAFKEAFDAVNENFQSIFATLSQGDGHLQLEDSDDPFRGGLNLVAHPKGKPVQRLASMSGGEKSLTALSFIFALQRYRPSPFYAFDEVDMFLDGANVERLARMIKQQAELAQFVVVSLRRPMIESAQRTIGVTQARGAHTQVLGINLQQETSASA